MLTRDAADHSPQDFSLDAVLLQPAKLVAEYRTRAPRSFDEALEAAVATYEDQFGQGFIVPFVRTLSSGRMRHFDIESAAPGLIDDRAMWQSELAELVKQTDAELIVVASQTRPVATPPSAILQLPRPPQATVLVDCLHADGRYLQAACQVEVGDRSAQRVTDWRLADLPPGGLAAGGNDTASVRRALARNLLRRR